MKVLNNFLEEIGVDKALHFLGGMLIVAKFFEYGNVLLAIIGFVLLFFLSIFKEYILDKDSGVDWYDIAYAMLGGLLELGTDFLIQVIR